VLSPNDVRTEEGWPRSSDPTADGIEPPAMGGAQPGQGDEPKAPTPAPASSDDEGEGGGKIARLDQRRGHHEHEIVAAFSTRLPLRPDAERVRE
jgi:hypothetical protein